MPGKQKAFHFAIEAFAGVVNKFPDLRLKIVGKGSLEKDLRQTSFDHHVADKVDFEGLQKDIIPYYLNAKGTLLTSIYEGYPKWKKKNESSLKILTEFGWTGWLVQSASQQGLQ